jgi:hypothetical protein
MNKRLLVDEVQLKKALCTLNQTADGKVDLSDVFGVINNCNIFIVDVAAKDIVPVCTASVRRRLEIQMGEQQ